MGYTRERRALGHSAVRGSLGCASRELTSRISKPSADTSGRNFAEIGAEKTLGRHGRDGQLSIIKSHSLLFLAT